jgi:ADP-ribose pyrophosphatase YjhB (NUDIX family)
MANWLPARLHRAALPLAHRLRHRWRRWRKSPIAGVSVILTNRAGEVLLLRHSYGPQVWALPGGGLPPREAAEAGARREVREELGLELGALHPVAVIEGVVSASPHTTYLFAAVTADTPRPDGREIIAAQFFPLANLPENLGSITAERLAAWQEWRALQQG